MCVPKPIGTLVFLRRNLFSCPQDVREAAYKGLLRPILEYGSSVWDPHYEGLILDDLEKVQKRAARFVTRNYTYEKGSMTGILKKLKWESSGGFRRGSGGSLEPPSRTKLFQFHAEIYEKSGKMLNTNPS